MSFRLTIAILTCVSMTACATVDLDQMASVNKASTSSSFDANVVQRATTKLFSAFTNKGLVAKSSQKRMQSAAQILLKGLEENEVISDQVSYLSTVSDAMIIKADIKTVSRHVEQTTKAAEVYLAMAPIQKSVNKELGLLEQALLASRAAETIFEEALLLTGSRADTPEFVSYKTSLDELTFVTDAFGDRVRGEYSRENSEFN